MLDQWAQVARCSSLAVKVTRDLRAIDGVDAIRTRPAKLVDAVDAVDDNVGPEAADVAAECGHITVGCDQQGEDVEALRSVVAGEHRVGSGCGANTFEHFRRGPALAE